MFRNQGHPLSDEEIQRIVRLLEKTDLSMTVIAERMDRTRSVIAKLNKEFQVRIYEGRRSHWELAAPRTWAR